MVFLRVCVRVWIFLTQGGQVPIVDAGILIPNSTEIYEPYEYGMDAGVFVKNGNFANV